MNRARFAVLRSCCSQRRGLTRRASSGDIGQCATALLAIIAALAPLSGEAGLLSIATAALLSVIVKPNVASAELLARASLDYAGILLAGLVGIIALRQASKP